MGPFVVMAGAMELLCFRILHIPVSVPVPRRRRRHAPAIPRRMVSDFSRGKRFVVLGGRILFVVTIFLLPLPFASVEITNAVVLLATLLGVVISEYALWRKATQAGDENSCYYE